MDPEKVLKKSWELSRQNKKIYIAPLVVHFIYMGVLLSFIGLVLFIGKYLSIFDIIEAINPGYTQKVLAIRLIVLFFVVSLLPVYIFSPLAYFSHCVIAQGILDCERGDITLRNVFYQPLRRLIPLLILSYILPILILIGLMFFVIPGMLIAFVSPIAFMALMRGNKVGESLKNTVRVIRKATGDFIILVLLLYAIGAVAGLMFMAPYLIGYLFFVGGLALKYRLAKIIGIGILAVGWVFVITLGILLSIFQKIAMMIFYSENTEEKVEVGVRGETPKLNVIKTISSVGGFVVILFVLSFLITGLLVLPIIGIHNMDDFKVSRGIYHASKGRYEEAIKLYDEVIINDNRHEVALIEKGESLYKLGKNQEALEAVDKALSINPKYPPALFKKSYILIQLRRFEEALVYTDEYLKQRPNEAAEWVNKGWILHELGREDEAIESYRKALEVRPRFKLALNDLGISLIEMGRYNEAIETLNKALEIDPNYIWALNNKGDAFIKLERYDEASAQFDYVLQLDPENSFAKNHKKEILMLKADTGTRSYDTVFEKSDIPIEGYVPKAEWGDCNNDGYLDIAYRSGPIFINERNGSFRKGQDLEYRDDFAFGDYDRDGDLDIFICHLYFDPVIYINDGACKFSKKYSLESENPPPGGFYNCHGALKDYDSDGDLDLLLVKGYYFEDTTKTNFTLYTNNGTDLTISMRSTISKGGMTNAISWGDYDNDGDLDLAVANIDQKNYLYKNNDGRDFTKIWEFGEGFTTTLVWGDYNNDGNLDIAEGNNNQDYLYTNNGDGTFTKAPAFGEGETLGMAWGDYDGDGDLDLVVLSYPRSYIYENKGDGGFSKTIYFEDIGSGSIGSGRGVAFGDYDNDGDLDLAIKGSILANMRMNK